MAGRRRGHGETDTVRINPIACDGIGMCAHLAPGVIGIDSWGYPLLPRQGISGRDLKAVRAAIHACPRKALFLESDPVT
jgi:ferredoxin